MGTECPLRLQLVLKALLLMSQWDTFLQVFLFYYKQKMNGCFLLDNAIYNDAYTFNQDTWCDSISISLEALANHKCHFKILRSAGIISQRSLQNT